MRKQDDRRPLFRWSFRSKRTPQVPDDLRLGINIYRGERVIEHKESGSHGSCAGQAEALTLPAGDAHAELADRGVFTLREGFDISAHRGQVQQWLQVVRSPGRAQEYVVGDGAGEKLEKTLLWCIPHQAWSCIGRRLSIQK